MTADFGNFVAKTDKKRESKDEMNRPYETIWRDFFFKTIIALFALLQIWKVKKNRYLDEMVL